MEKSEKLRSNNLIYLDTSAPKAVIGLVDIDQEFPTFRFRNWEAGRELSATLATRIEEMLAENKIDFGDITGIVVFVGPGSFTGLRIGISFANGLAYSLGIPIFETKEKENFDLQNPKKIALPFYGSEPIITKAKK